MSSFSESFCSLERWRFAQSDHKIEVTGNYSYIHANPQNNNIIPTFSLNGGGGSGAFYFSKYIGIVAEFEGYGSYTHNFTVPARVNDFETGAHEI